MSMAHHRRRARRDDGYTLVEMLVSMGIFTTVVAILMGSVTILYHSVTKAGNVSQATTLSRSAINRLDRELRYATAINRPARSGQDWYLEFAALGTSGTEVCRQWRLLGTTDVLQERTWAASAGTAPAWATVATNVVNDPTALPPFVFAPASTTQVAQQVTVQLRVSRGAVDTGAVYTTTVLVARNTSVNTVTNADTDADGVSDTQVCTTFGRS